jgi:hypothetical protein
MKLYISSTIQIQTLFHYLDISQRYISPFYNIPYLFSSALVSLMELKLLTPPSPREMLPLFTSSTIPLETLVELAGRSLLFNAFIPDNPTIL